MNDDDNRDRPRMVDNDAIDSQALTGGDVTRYRALVARISYLSQDRPDLKFAAMQVCCAMANPTVRDSERVKRIGRIPRSAEPRAKVLVPLATAWWNWRPTQMLTGGGDKSHSDGRSQAGVIMRGSRCHKVWTKKQRVVALVRPAESE